MIAADLQDTLDRLGAASMGLIERRSRAILQTFQAFLAVAPDPFIPAFPI